MPELKEKRVELILQQLQQLPTLPAVAVKVIEATGRDETSARQVVDLISSDPPLTAKILQLVHRSDHGVSGQVTTVERAVVLLGFDAVRSAVLAVSIYRVFAAETGEAGAHFNREAFWRHALAVATCAELLAEMMGGRQSEADPSEAFVCGLLHDLGKIALSTILPKSYDRVAEAADLLRGDIAQLEKTVIGLDHHVVGKRLAEQWQLPAAIRECAWLHGQNPAVLPASMQHARLVNLITLADAVVRDQHLGYSGNYTPLPFKADLMRALEIDPADVAQAQQKLIAQIEQRASILGLGQVSSGELYVSAMAAANRELGRVSEQLAARNRRLSARTRLFDALSRFQGELRPDATPAEVLQAIAQTAVVAIRKGPLAAFSCQPGEAVAEVVLLDGEGETIGTSVIECPPNLARPAGGNGPVLPAGQELEWILSSLSPSLRGEMRYWMCLEGDGACIGGVIWGADKGEGERLSTQAQELTALSSGWGLSLRIAQIREESRTLSEQLAESNRQLQNAQAELLRKSTLATVGELAAGAAHEMNNPLAVISGRSQLLARQLSDQPDLKHAATTIAEQSHRLSQIITDLMEFARPVPPNPRPMDLAELLDQALYEAKTLTAPANRLIEVTMDRIPDVIVDGEQVRAAFAQILHNALQATDENKGRIMIHAAYDSLSCRVVVSIEDNGRGMDEVTVKRAFDPFYSNLPAGRRRGLGLAKALRWVESSGGSIRLESHLHQGTRAMVLLPAEVQPAGQRTAQRQRRIAESS